MDVALELTKVDATKVNIQEVCATLTNLNTSGKIQALRTFVAQGSSTVDDLEAVVGEVVEQQHAMHLAPSVPYVLDATGRPVIIPVHLYGDVLRLINRSVTPADS